MSLYIPDKTQQFDDIVLGSDCIDVYLSSKEKYFGATIGPYGNCIANAEFEIDGNSYILVKNDVENYLHGGIKGFHNVFWDINQINKQTIELKYSSPDMAEGFPGNLNVNVVYCLTNNNEFKIEYFV